MPISPPHTSPSWVKVLAATFTLQMINAYLYYLTPTLAPEISRSVGEQPEFIGWLVAFGTAGSMLFMLVGTPIMRRLGSLRSLQAGALLSGLGAVLLVIPTLPTVVLANVLIGIGYAPALPAGSELLRSHAPLRHRNLLFSVRQAAVPISGLAAGLVLPLIYASGGWPLVIETSAGMVIVSVFAVQPLRALTDNHVHRAPLRVSDIFEPQNIVAPLAAIARERLMALSIAGACLGAGQGCWTAYLVTWLEHSGLSLVQSGTVFAIMQAASVIGRLGLGWLSDCVGSPVPALGMAVVGSCMASLFVALGPDVRSSASLLYGLSAAAGILTSSWNGVLVAAVAGNAPLGKIAMCTSGLTIIAYAGFLIGPALFALVLGETGSFRVAFGVTALMTSVGLAGLSFAAAQAQVSGRV